MKFLSISFRNPRIDSVTNFLPTLLGASNKNWREGNEQGGWTGEIERMGLEGEEKREVDIDGTEIDWEF